MGYTAGLALLAVAAYDISLVAAAPSTCVYRFEGYWNVSEYPTWTLPRAEPYAENATVLNEDNPFVYQLSDTESEPVNCTVTSWQYDNNGTWDTELYYPDEEPVNPTEFQELFSANGSYLLAEPVPASVAVALSDSLKGRTVQVNLECDTEQTVEDDDSCVVFELEFTNYSPIPEVGSALFRFADPAVPAFELPPAQPISPGDIRLNHDNPISDLDGSETSTACNGDIAEYLGEDGEWYFWYTGSDGNMYNLTHVFYAANTSHLNIATIQKVWSPNMEAALYNRTVRLLIHCTNADEYEEGYLFFNIGEENSVDLVETCETLPELCAELAGSGAASNRFYRGMIGGRQSWMMTLGYAVMVVAGAAAAFVL